MGGILDACGVPGLLGNQDQLEELADGGDDDFQRLMQAVADEMSERVCKGKDAHLYVSTKSREDQAEGRFGLFDILHGMDDVPALDGWGYQLENGRPVYENTNKAGRRFKAAATRVYDVEVQKGQGKHAKRVAMLMSFERDDKTKSYKVALKDCAR